MTKQAFLDKLRSRLSILDDNEVDDIINNTRTTSTKKSPPAKPKHKPLPILGTSTNSSKPS